jgi:hypothetical protein
MTMTSDQDFTFHKTQLRFYSTWLKQQYPPWRRITYRQHSWELRRLFKRPLSCWETSWTECPAYQLRGVKCQNRVRMATGVGFGPTALRGRLLVTANVVPSSPILVTLMKEALSSSETSALTRSTRRNIPEDTVLHLVWWLPENLERNRMFLRSLYIFPSIHVPSFYTENLRNLIEA